jgi:hypothetical protein
MVSELYAGLVLMSVLYNAGPGIHGSNEIELFKYTKAATASRVQWAAVSTNDS